MGEWARAFCTHLAATWASASHRSTAHLHVQAFWAHTPAHITSTCLQVWPQHVHVCPTHVQRKPTLSHIHPRKATRLGWASTTQVHAHPILGPPESMRRSTSRPGMPTKCLALPGVDADGRPKLGNIGRPRIQDGCPRCPSRGPPQTRVEIHAFGLWTGMDAHRATPWKPTRWDWTPTLQAWATIATRHWRPTHCVWRPIQIGLDGHVCWMEAHVLRVDGQYASITRPHSRYGLPRTRRGPPHLRYGRPRCTCGLPGNPRGEPHVLDGCPRDRGWVPNATGWTLTHSHVDGQGKAAWRPTHLGMHVQCHAFGPPRHLATTHVLDGQKSDGHARDMGTHEVGSSCSWTPTRPGLATPGDMWQTSRVYVGPTIGHVRCYGRAPTRLAATCTGVALWTGGRDARMATYTLCAGVGVMCAPRRVLWACNATTWAGVRTEWNPTRCVWAHVRPRRTENF